MQKKSMGETGSSQHEIKKLTEGVWFEPIKSHDEREPKSTLDNEARRAGNIRGARTQKKLYHMCWLDSKIL